jgi:hypothetical protein
MEEESLESYIENIDINASTGIDVIDDDNTQEEDVQDGGVSTDNVVSSEVKPKVSKFKKRVVKNIDTTVDEFTAGSTDKLNSNTGTVKSSGYMDIETEYNKKIFSNYIVEELEKRNIDLLAAANKQKSGNEDFWKLNLLIRECRNQNKCTTVEFCVELFEQHFDKISSVISLLNEENYFLLKSELRKLYRLDGYKLTSVIQNMI